MVVQISETEIISFNSKLVDIERLSGRIESFIAKNNSSSAIVIPTYNTRHEYVVKLR